jgi:hypothetical protein
MDKKALVSKYLELHQLYENTEHVDTIHKIEDAFSDDDLETAKILIESLRDKNQLLTDLSEKLKGKPVYTTLRRLLEGKIDNKYVALKGLSSLMTHIAIEAEKGNMEYVPLLREINTQYNTILEQ